MNVSATPMPQASPSVVSCADPVATLRRLNDSLERTAELVDLGVMSREVAAEAVGQIIEQLNTIRQTMQEKWPCT